MIAEGRYIARAVGTPQVGCASTGTKEIAVEFEIAEGEQKGQRYVWHGFFTENTTNRTIESLVRCGWDGDDIYKCNGISKNLVSVVIEHKQSQDGSKTYPRIAWVNDASGARVAKPMDKAEMLEFGQRMRAVAKSQGAAGAPATRARDTSSTRYSHVDRNGGRCMGAVADDGGDAYAPGDEFPGDEL